MFCSNLIEIKPAINSCLSESVIFIKKYSIFVLNIIYIMMLLYCSVRLGLLPWSFVILSDLMANFISEIVVGLFVHEILLACSASLLLNYVASPLRPKLVQQLPSSLK